MHVHCQDMEHFALVCTAKKTRAGSVTCKYARGCSMQSPSPNKMCDAAAGISERSQSAFLRLWMLAWYALSSAASSNWSVNWFSRTVECMRPFISIASAAVAVAVSGGGGDAAAIACVSPSSFTLVVAILTRKYDTQHRFSVFAFFLLFFERESEREREGTRLCCA